MVLFCVYDFANSFCRWPAVVTPEPLTDAGHASKSSLGEITHYHMEFLGLPHSHGWVSSKHISFFTEQSIDCQLSSRSDVCPLYVSVNLPYCYLP